MTLLMGKDGREALQGILSPEDYTSMVQRSAQGTEHGGITILSPQFRRLFHMRQYKGQQPQFIHRWLLREILVEGVNIQRGKRLTRVDNAKREGRAELIFQDGSTDSADLVVGTSTETTLLEGADLKELTESVLCSEASYTRTMHSLNDSPTSIFR